MLAAGGVGGAGDVKQGSGKAAGHMKANGKLVLVERVRKVLRAHRLWGEWSEGRQLAYMS